MKLFEDEVAGEGYCYAVQSRKNDTGECPISDMVLIHSNVEESVTHISRKLTVSEVPFNVCIPSSIPPSVAKISRRSVLRTPFLTQLNVSPISLSLSRWTISGETMVLGH